MTTTMTAPSGKRRKLGQKEVRFADEEGSELETIHLMPSLGGFDDEIDATHGRSEASGINTDQSSGQERPTSQVTVLSSAHGRARRELRDVAIFDLQSAVKHGVRTRGHNCPKTGMPRWKFVHGNVVYITDYTCTREVTSYKQAVEIVPADISPEMMDRHLKEKQVLQEDPQLCATHTIVIIDQSGSMRASDVPGFKTRSQAAYGVLALEYVAEQLHQRGTGSRVIDAVSVIEMNDFGSIVCERCPLDWILFNQLLARQKAANPRSHGNYNWALVAATELIARDVQGLEEADMDDLPSYAIIFLSDGKPSDNTPSDAEDRLLQLLTLCEGLKSNLSFHAIGLASSAVDFQALRTMVETVKASGGEATFSFSELSSAQLSAAFTSASTSVTATRTEKMSAAEERGKRQEKEVQLRGKSVPKNRRKFQRFLHTVSRWGFDRELYRRNEYAWVQTKFKNKGGAGFDIEVDPFGKGAERLAYMFHEIDRNKRRLGKELVAKESIHINREDRKMAFHEAFCRVQDKADELARQFNSVVDRTPSLAPTDRAMKTPKISFLECYVYEYEAEDGTKCGLLVEDYLMGKFTKYNSNNGYMRNPKGGSTIDLQIGEVYLTDFVQAFSHWVYFSTDQRLLVCDLQGVLDEDGRFPRFRLTDPCICSKKGKGVGRYGRSDMRMKGIRIFRQKHECNGVCKGLGLPSF